MSAPWYRIERLYLYVYRTRRHRGWGVHNGYTGITNHPRLRDRQHQAKPWYDLVTRRHCVCIGVMPRFLGLALEYLLIKLTLPVYNVQHNSTNPRRVKPWDAKSQRLARDANPRMIKLYPSPLTVLPVVVVVVGALALWSR